MRENERRTGIVSAHEVGRIHRRVLALEVRETNVEVDLRFRGAGVRGLLH